MCFLADINNYCLCLLINCIIFFIIGLVFIGLVIPMILRKIPPNGYYGFRTPKAFSSEKIWYEINWYCGRDCFVIGLLLCIYNLILFLFQSSIKNIDIWGIAGNLLILGVGPTLMLIRGLIHLKKL